MQSRSFSRVRAVKRMSIAWTFFVLTSSVFYAPHVFSAETCLNLFATESRRVVSYSDAVPVETIASPLLPKLITDNPASFEVIGKTLVYRFTGTTNGAQSLRIVRYREDYLGIGKIARTVVVRDVDGSQYKFTVRNSWPSKMIVDLSVGENRTNRPLISESDLLQLRANFQSILTENSSKDLLGSYLTKLHLQTSKNFKYRADRDQIEHGLKNNLVENVEFGDAVLQANRLTANLLVTQKNLTAQDLAQINYLMNQGVDIHGQSSLNYMAGLYRGLRTNDVSFNGEKIDVDLTSAEVAQGSAYVNWFVRAKDVPEQTSSLLKRINNVDTATPLPEIFLIYRNFIEVHPFMEGNGRTGRTLLNYMLLRAGFPPILKTPESLYYNEHELADAYTNAILHE